MSHLFIQPTCRRNSAQGTHGEDAGPLCATLNPASSVMRMRTSELACGTTMEPKPVSISTAPMPWSMRRCRLTGLCLRHMSLSSFASTCAQRTISTLDQGMSWSCYC